MLLSGFLIVSLLSVPLFGGRLRLLADLRFRAPGLLLSALVLQILVIELLPGTPRAAAAGAHLLSYGLAGAFLWINRRIPGLWLIGLGCAANAAAIAANGGVMPASASALRTAGLPLQRGAEGFVNSVGLAHPKLLMLGDIFAIPESWPLSNVFSAGDVCMALGGAYAVHRICGSRLTSAKDRGKKARLEHRSGG